MTLRSGSRYLEIPRKRKFLLEDRRREMDGVGKNETDRRFVEFNRSWRRTKARKEGGWREQQRDGSGLLVCYR